MKKCKLGDIAEFRNGVNYSKGEQGYSYKCIGVTDFSQEYVMSQFEECAKVELDNAINSDYILEDGDILLVRSNGNKNLIGRSMMVFPKDEKVIYSGFCIRCRITSESVYPAYVLFILKDALVKGRFAKNQQTNINNINQTVLSDLEIMLPDYPLQKKIADILLAFTNKIEQNKLMIEVLESMSKTLYDYWFVQFDFPDANGRPYKTSGGKMVWNEELGREIPAGWRTTNIGYITENFDSQRIPLSAKERQMMKGEIPYYGATDVMDYVNRPIFTGQYVLIAEDGSVMDNDGFPFVQMIYGDSWVNNHAHVLRGKNGYSNECLYLLLKEIPVVSIKTGSIQAKINQNNLNSYKVVLPPNDIMSVFDDKVIPFFEKLRNLKEENRKLSSLRDFLLPMLMNGQVTFRL